jgi:hypothetical protein
LLAASLAALIGLGVAAVYVFVNRELPESRPARAQSAAEIAAEAMRELTLADGRRREWEPWLRLNEEAAAEKRRLAEADRRSRRATYFSDMQLAQAAWENNRPPGVRDLLDRHCPKPDQEDLRGFEWYYWNRLCQRRLVRDSLAPEFEGALLPIAGAAEASATSKETPGFAKPAPEGTRILEGHSAAVYSVRFSADGKFLTSAGMDQTLRIWNLVSGSIEVATEGPTGEAQKVAWSPDGSLVAVVQPQSSVRVLATAGDREPVELRGHKGALHAIEFSPDGQRIASAGEDQTLRLWDSVTGQETLKIRLQTSAPVSVSISSDGTLLAAGLADGTIAIWEAPRKK